MDWLPLLFGVGSAGLFASRAFLTAFVTALLLRFQPDLPLLPDLLLPDPTGSEPTWITSDLALWVLGALALVEVLAEKNPDARALLAEVSRFAKPAMAALTLFGVLDFTDQEYVEETLKQGGVFGPLLVAFVTLLTAFLANARATVVATIDEVDADGALGLGKLTSWLEDLWSIFGVFWLLVYPIIAVALIGPGRRSACGGCGCAPNVARSATRSTAHGCAGRMHRAALACPHLWWSGRRPPRDRMARRGGR